MYTYVDIQIYIYIYMCVLHLVCILRLDVSVKMLQHLNQICTVMRDALSQVRDLVLSYDL